MKYLVLGRILIVIGVIYPAIVGAMFLGSLASKEPVDVSWGLFTICSLILFAGCVVEDKGKRQRKITNGHQQLK